MTNTTTHTYRAWAYGDVDGALDSRELEIIGGRVTLDETWSPHIQATLEVTMPDATGFGYLDPRSGMITQLFISAARDDLDPEDDARSWFLTVTRRDVDPEAGTVRVEASSWETILQRRVHLSEIPNQQAFPYQSSLRNIVDNVVLQPTGFATLYPGPDVAVPILTDSTNLIPNPSFENNLNGWTGVGCTIATDTAWAADGVRALVMSSPTSATSYAYCGPVNGGGEMFPEVNRGDTYTLSGTFRITAPLTGSTDGNARRLLVIARRGSASNIIYRSDAAPNVAGTYRLSVTFTVPVDATELTMRAYHGHTAGTARWDAFAMVPSVPGDLTEGTYWAGNSPSTSNYTYGWQETAGNSRSDRIALVERPSEALQIQAGDTLWDFVNDLAQASGMRLFNDWTGGWNLVDSTYVAPGGISLIWGSDIISLTESIDVESSDSAWCDAAIVTYRWRAKSGEYQERIDAFGSTAPTKVIEVTIERPYPGPGFAQYIVQRSQARGRDLTITAVSDYRVLPSQALTVGREDGTTQECIVRAVDFDLTSDEMTIQTRDPE